jgi:hypothetical protein
VNFKQVDKLKEIVEQVRTTDIAKAESSRPYYEAKQNLEEQLQLRRNLNMKLAAEGVDLSLPKTTTVEILERAKPPGERTAFLAESRCADWWHVPERRTR